MAVKPISTLSRNAWHHGTTRYRNSSALHKRSYRGVFSSDQFRWAHQSSARAKHSSSKVLTSSSGDGISGSEEPQVGLTNQAEQDAATVSSPEGERATAVSTSGGMCTSSASYCVKEGSMNRRVMISMQQKDRLDVCACELWSNQDCHRMPMPTFKRIGTLIF